MPPYTIPVAFFARLSQGLSYASGYQLMLLFGSPFTSIQPHGPLSTPGCLCRLQAPGRITTTNPQWGGRADLRIGGRSSDPLIGNQIPTADPKKNRCFKCVPTKVLLLRRSTCPCLGSTIRLGPPQRGVPGDPFGLDPKNDEGLGGRAIETAEVAAEIRRHPLKILENRT